MKISVFIGIACVDIQYNACFSPTFFFHIQKTNNQLHKEYMCLTTRTNISNVITKHRDDKWFSERPKPHENIFHFLLNFPSSFVFRTTSVKRWKIQLHVVREGNNCKHKYSLFILIALNCGAFQIPDCGTNFPFLSTKRFCFFFSSFKNRLFLQSFNVTIEFVRDWHRENVNENRNCEWWMCQQTFIYYGRLFLDFHVSWILKFAFGSHSIFEWITKHKYFA